MTLAVIFLHGETIDMAFFDARKVFTPRVQVLLTQENLSFF